MVRRWRKELQTRACSLRAVVEEQSSQREIHRLGMACWMRKADKVDAALVEQMHIAYSSASVAVFAYDDVVAAVVVRLSDRID